MTSDVLDQTIDLETKGVVSSAPLTLRKRSPRSAGSSQRPLARAG
jgi:hypothetical protein